MKKRWGILFLVFLIGILSGAGGCWFLSKRWVDKIGDQASDINEYLTIGRAADVYVRSLKAIDGGTNTLQKYQRLARDNLSGYLHEADNLRSNANFEWPDFGTYEEVEEYLYPNGPLAIKKRAVLEQTMLPVVRGFIRRHEIPVDSDFQTNEISRWKFSFYKKRNGGQGDVRLQNRYAFMGRVEKGKAEIWNFKDGAIKTYYDMFFASRKEIEVAKALNLKNKLDKKAAIELATKYFKLQGHKVENFHPPECLQRYWAGTNLSEDHNLPYYGVEWFRKDVKMTDVEQGFVRPSVVIEVSGITTNLISYTKSGMPLGSDF